MSEKILRPELVEKAAEAVHWFRCCTVGEWHKAPTDADRKLARHVLIAVADDIRAEALQAAATSYQMGGWATLPQAAGNLAAKRKQAEHAVAWLRDRADRIGARHD